ncbi:MAG: ribosome biogenesis GTPase Der [Eubacteriaceae bacterium]|nr:ribosome biogenesis GTPase Der [Eubacteriaceae bacterium]
MKKSYIALVGRPNTGKSTLFNRLAGRRISIVDDTPGVTRDRVIAESSWLDRPYYIIDTGGIEPHSTDPISIQIKKQAAAAMDMADAIILVVDGREGPTAIDYEIADMIRKGGGKAIVAVNKLDSYSLHQNAYDFYSLSLGDPIPVSAEHGSGIGDVLDAAFSLIGDGGDGGEQEAGAKRIAVVGKPNTGKSTLINCISGEERAIVSEMPGTTRDSIDTEFEYNGERYILTDTAGLKKRSQTTDAISYYASVRAAKAIELSDLCIFMIDATVGVTEQDMKIASQILDAKKAIVIAVNKWDLIEKDSKTMAEMEKAIKNALYFISFAQVAFISAIDGGRVSRLMDAVEAALEEYYKRVSTGLINEVISMAVSMSPMPTKGGRRLSIYYASQVSVAPPKMLLFVNDETLMTKQYQRYLDGRIRSALGFYGSPIDIQLRERKSSRS